MPKSTPLILEMPLSRFSSGIPANEMDELFWSIRKARHVPSYILNDDPSTPDKLKYATSFQVSWFLRQEISQQQFDEACIANQQFQKRAANLLPTLFAYLDFRETGYEQSNAISLLDDTHYDYTISIGAPRSDRKRKKILNEVKAAEKALREATERFRAIEPAVGYEVEAFLNRYKVWDMETGKSMFILSIFLTRLEVLTELLSIVRARINTDPEFPMVSGNDVRSDIVKAAHTMCVWWRGPELKTTPGSDFSNFASILFEIVSGEPDASLAGAINRYARSKERDEFELSERAWEQDDEAQFHKERLRTSRREVKNWAKVLEAGGLTKFGTGLAIKLLESQIAEAKGILSEAEAGKSSASLQAPALTSTDEK